MQPDGAPRPLSQGSSSCPQQSRHHPFLGDYFSRSDSSFFRSRASRRALSSHPVTRPPWPWSLHWSHGREQGKLAGRPPPALMIRPEKRKSVGGAALQPHWESRDRSSIPPGAEEKGQSPHPDEHRHAELWRLGCLHRILRTYRIPSFSPRALLQPVL